MSWGGYPPRGAVSAIGIHDEPSAKLVADEVAEQEQVKQRVVRDQDHVQIRALSRARRPRER